MNLTARFAALKKKIGGNRDKQSFEFTMCPDVGEKAGITGLPPYLKRIFAELNFSLQLSKNRNGMYDDLIEKALDSLESAFEQDGCLTRNAAMLAEGILLPMSEEAKSYEVLYVAHAHIDMNWMWSWHETVAVTLSTFRTMLNLMKEYPDFTFSQSQASVYRIVEKYDPEMMEEIKQRIREGRWEITANAWVETDKNMPDTESLMRHISVTRNYLQEKWGIEPGSVKVDFSPDTFGHSRFVPEINRLGGVPYYYHCRGLQDELTLYRFRAPSGAETLNYKEPYWYNSGVCPDNGTGVFEIERRCCGLKTALIVYGVGDHGGGATRRDVETMLEMRKWPVFPTLRFGTLHAFFEKAESVRDRLPVIDHELNAIFTGCYSTQSRIKLANRHTEAALIDSERANALIHHGLGGPLSDKRYTEAWQNLLFTHFHDILTGSCVQESREYAMGLLSDSLAYAQTEQQKAYRIWAEAVDTSMFAVEEDIADSRSEGGGVGFGVGHYAGVPNPERGAGLTRIYTVFNPSAYGRTENVEITVWDYAGDLKQIEVVNHLQEKVPFEVIGGRTAYWDHTRIRILITADVPAFGHAVYAVRQKEITDYPTFLLHDERVELPKENIVLENEYVRATFDTGCGRMLSWIDKTTGEEMLSAPAGLCVVRTEDSDMSAWRIGRYMGIVPVDEVRHVTFSANALRTSVTFEMSAMHSDIKMSVSLDSGSKAVLFDMEIDWRETAKAQNYLPLLSYRVPLKRGGEQILTDVPSGFAFRPAQQMDVPALTSACAKVEGNTIALVTDCKYGYRLAEDTLSVTLINTAGTPDLYPERGIHAIKMWMMQTKADPCAVKRSAECLTRPMAAVPTGSHAGALEPRQSLMRIESTHCVVSSVGTAKDGSMFVRLFEDEGISDAVCIRPPFPASRAALTDLDGKKLEDAEVRDGCAEFCIAPHRLVQVQIYR